jgi:hypothetical protein
MSRTAMWLYHVKRCGSAVKALSYVQFMKLVDKIDGIPS